MTLGTRGSVAMLRDVSSSPRRRQAWPATRAHPAICLAATADKDAALTVVTIPKETSRA